MAIPVRYPADHMSFTVRCHKPGRNDQAPAAALSTQGDYNCLHQNLYGEHVFPLQVVILLSAPERRFHR